MKKQKQETKEKQREPTFKTAEGKFESVGVQNGVCYIVVGGKKMSCDKNEFMKVEIKKR